MSIQWLTTQIHHEKTPPMQLIYSASQTIVGNTCKDGKSL